MPFPSFENYDADAIRFGAPSDNIGLQGRALGDLVLAAQMQSPIAAAFGVQYEHRLDNPAPASAGTTALSGDDADANSITAGITGPDVPRGITITYGASWAGGDHTVYGTDQYGRDVSEVFVANPGGTTVGAVPFATVTRVDKEIVGAGGAGHEFSLDYNDIIGLVIPGQSEPGALLADPSSVVAFKTGGGIATMVPAAPAIDAANDTIDLDSETGGGFGFRFTLYIDPEA